MRKHITIVVLTVATLAFGLVARAHLEPALNAVIAAA